MHDTVALAKLKYPLTRKHAGVLSCKYDITIIRDSMPQQNTYLVTNKPSEDCGLVLYENLFPFVVEI